MNFGELKTTVFAGLPKEWQDKVSVFEFGEAIDDAQRLFATVLPESVIPELMIQKFIDPRSDVGATDIFPLPEDYLKAEKVRFAQVRDESNDPLRRDARIVEVAEFEELKAAGSTERIAAIFNNLLHVSPDPAAAVASAPASLRMIYRKRPRPYTTTSGVLLQAARIHLLQDLESRHTFYAYDYDTIPEQRSWEYWDLDVNELIGGFVYMGGSLMTDDTKAPMYVMRIVQAWDDESSHGIIRVSGDDEVPIDDETPGVLGFTFPYCYVAQRPVFGYSGSMVEAEDHEFPDIGPNWHHLVCQYAISKFEERYNPQSAQSRLGRVFQVLAGAGAKLDVTKES